MAESTGGELDSSFSSSLFSIYRWTNRLDQEKGTFRRTQTKSNLALSVAALGDSISDAVDKDVLNPVQGASEVVAERLAQFGVVLEDVETRLEGDPKLLETVAKAKLAVTKAEGALKSSGDEKYMAAKEYAKNLNVDQKQSSFAWLFDSMSGAMGSMYGMYSFAKGKTGLYDALEESPDDIELTFLVPRKLAEYMDVEMTKGASVPVSVRVSAKATVSQLKERFFAKFLVPVSWQELHFGGAIMADSEKLTSLGVVAGAEVHLETEHVGGFPLELSPFGSEETSMDLVQGLKLNGSTWDLSSDYWTAHPELSKFRSGDAAMSPIHEVVEESGPKVHSDNGRHPFFAWCYPLASGSTADSSAWEAVQLGSRKTYAADLRFMLVGGYVYFDRDKKPKQAISISPNDPKGLLRFNPPQHWKRAWTEPLAKKKRFQRITVESFRACGAQYFCWLNPLEVLGDVNAPRNGAFVYLFSKDMSPHGADCYFELAPQGAEAASVFGLPPAVGDFANLLTAGGLVDPVSTSKAFDDMTKSMNQASAAFTGFVDATKPMRQADIQDLTATLKGVADTSKGLAKMAGDQNVHKFAGLVVDGVERVAASVPSLPGHEEPTPPPTQEPTPTPPRKEVPPPSRCAWCARRKAD